MSDRLDFNAVLEGLRSVDRTARDLAVAEVGSWERLGMNTVEALRALQAATDTYPSPSSGTDTAALLVRAAGRAPRRVYVPVIEEAFARYRTQARVEALHLLLCTGVHGAHAYLRLVRMYAAELPTLSMNSVLEERRHLDILFPEILVLTAPHPRHLPEVCKAASTLCGEGLLEPGALAAALAPLLLAEAARSQHPGLDRASTRTAGEPHACSASALHVRAAVLDLLGWLPGAEPLERLRRALEDDDPRVRATARAALERRRPPGR